MENLLSTLARLNISLEIKGDNLDLYDPDDNLTEALLDAIRENKAEIRTLLMDVEEGYKFAVIPKAETKDYYVCSSAQKRLYFLFEMDRDSVAYNMPQVHKFNEALDPESLTQAFNKLIARHESYRTTFHLNGDEPMQKIAKTIDFEVTFTSCDSSELKQVVNDFIRPFDLTQGPLLRAGIAAISANEHYFMFDIHHIISDAVSSEIMYNDFLALYNKEILPSLSLQYKDYAEWQQSEGQQEKLKLQKKFWLDKFSEEIPVLELPNDYPRPLTKTYDGDSLSFSISKIQTADLRALARKQEVTLFMLILALYKVLLSKLSNQEDIIVGTPVAGRQHVDLENMIGLFVNTLPIRSHVKSNNSFLDFLESVKEDVVACFENQSVQYEELIDALRVIRNTGRNPLFDVFFVFDAAPEGAGETSPVQSEIEAYDSGYRVSKFDLSFSARYLQGQIHFGFEYSKDLFKKETIERFVIYFNNLVSAILQNPNQKIFEIDVLSEAEKHKLLYEFNPPPKSYEPIKNILQLFEQQVIKTPKNIALRTDQVLMTYEELKEQSDKIARYLLEEKQLKVGDFVGILLERELSLIPWIFGILKAGGAYIPLDTKNPVERINTIIEESGLRLLVTREAYADDSFASHCQLINLEDTIPLINEIESGAIDVDVGPNDLAYLIFTSGSTGKPKGVMIEHQSLSNLIQGMDEQYPLGATDGFLFKTTYAFDVSVAELFGWFLNGGSLTILASGAEGDPEAIVETVARHKVSHLNFVPSMFSIFVEALNSSMLEKIKSLKYLFLAGEALSLDLIQQFKALNTNIKLENIYGPTEATIYCTGYSTEKLNGAGRVPIGRPLPNMAAYIVDQNNRLQPLEVPGELCLGGIGLARGYLNRPTFTDEKFIPNPFKPKERIYKTGDLARWLSDGNIEYLGRIDNQVKVRGFRIELGEIENRLALHPAVTASAVLVKEREGDKYLVAYYGAEQAIEPTELNRYLSESLPEYMIPNYFVWMDEMPLTASGKLNRKALPTPEIIAGMDYVAPANTVEEKLVEIWSEILKLDKEVIGTNKNFFQMGGHSLKATLMVNRIFKFLEVKVPLKEVFIHQTIKSLSDFILRSQKSKYSTIEETVDWEHYPLSSAQKRMYFLYSLDPDSLAYNMPHLDKFTRKLDREKLTRAFTELISRHEILRTTFHLIEEVPVQIVNPKSNFTIEYQKAEASEVDSIFKKFVRPFDLQKGPLLRAAVITVSDEEEYVLVDMHHIITDGVSQGIMLDDFLALYDEVMLPPLALQYKDYAVWQQSEAQQEQQAAQEKFWLSEFIELPDVLNLPTDFVRPLYKTHAGGNLSWAISEQETKQLKVLAKENDATLYMVLFSVFAILLSKLSHQKDLVIGTPVAGRQHADLENMIGLFVNTVLIRNTIVGTDSFNDFLFQVKTKVLACLDNQDFQYEELIEALELPRDSSRNPLFDVMFAFNNFMEPLVDAPLRDTESYVYREVISKFDLSLTITQTEQQLFFGLDYSADLFERETIERFVTYFRKIITSVIATPGIQISSIELLSEKEKQQLLYEFNPVATIFPEHLTLIDLFEERVLATPQAIALIYNGEEVTYDLLNRKSNQLAHYLINQGLKTGEVAGIMLDRSVEMIIAILGVLKAGGIYLPLNEDQPISRTNYLLRESASRLVLTSSRYAPMFQQQLPVIDVYFSDIYKQPEANLCLSIASSSPAYIIYTSGSTGNPKGVVVAHQAVVNLIRGQQSFFGITSSDRILQFSPYYFDASVEQIWLALLSSATLVLIDKAIISNNEAFNQFIGDYTITHLHATPSFLETLELEGENSLLRIVAGGEVCKTQLANKYKDQISFYNEYGPTETTVTTIQCLVTEKEIVKDKIVIGKPIANTSAYILDENLQLQPIGVAGELYLGGMGLSTGYLNDSDLTTERFITNPFNEKEKIYKTGDLACWLADGNIDYLGRIDTQVKIRGYRIELGEIEHQIRGYSGIEESAVVVKEIEGDKYLVGYYVAKQELAKEKLNAHLSQVLPGYMIPSFWVYLETMPLSASGKLNHKALPDIDLAAKGNYVPPATFIEEQLVSIWSKVLKLEAGAISTNKSFFELGGHSLKATVMVNRIFKELEVKVPLREIFTYQTIQQLGAYIQKAGKSFYHSIPKVTDKDYYKMSSAQKRMYFLYAFEPHSLAYNMPQVNKYEEGLDQDKLIEAFNKLIDRHEILRTTFHLIEDKPMQKVNPTVNFEIPFYKAKAEELDTIFNDFVQPFNLSEGPLLRAGIVAVSPQEQYLLVDMHHIITDGVSYGIMLAEFLALYEGKELPPVYLQYKDYAEWQQSESQQQEIELQEAFWLNEFKEEWDTLDLPTDFPRPAVKSYLGKSLDFTLDKKTTAQLRLLSEEQGVTPFMVLLSCFILLLNKLTGQRDIIVGTPVAGRQHADLEKMLGLFVNTLALRNQVKGDQQFLDFLAAVKSNVLAGFENQSYQYEELIEALQVARDTSRNPLFDVMFAYNNFVEQEEDRKTENLQESLEQISDDTTVSKFDLTLSVSESKSKLMLSFEYSLELFQSQTIERLTTYFQTLLKSILTQPKQKIENLALISAKEKHQILYDFNATQLDFPQEKTVLNLFEEQVLNNPENIALLEGEQKISYWELDQRANQIARYLQVSGATKGDRIGLLVTKSAEMIIGLLGILKMGCAYVPTEEDQPMERNLSILKEANVKLLLTDQTDHRLTECDWRVVNIYEQQLKAESTETIESTPSVWDTAYVIYTSGSTGTPKGVEVQHHSLTNMIYAQSRSYGITAADRILQFSSIIFDASVEQIWLALTNGAALLMIKKAAMLDTVQLNEDLRRFEVSHLDVTPSFLESITLSSQKSLQRIIVGGEACKWQTLRKYHQQFKIFNAYGPTEATVTSVMRQISLSDLEAHKTPIGKPIANTVAYILDAHLQPCPIGVKGELFIGGSCLAKGYLNDEKLTGKKFIADPFREGERMYQTGDLVRWLPDGNIEYVERVDSQVKIRGFRIELGEIENCIKAYEPIREVSVIAKTIKGEKKLIAYYVAPVAIDPAQLSNYLSAYLPSYMIPSGFVALERMPLTAGGKLNHKVLPLPQIQVMANIKKPSTEHEEKLVAIWSEVLGVEPEAIGVQQNFFDLGGHSLKAIQLVSKIKNVFGFDLPLIEVFKFTNIESLAQRIPAAITQSIVDNETLSLLKYLEPSAQNLFFIHDGSGDIQGYLELVELIEDHNCWGVRSAGLNQLGPKNERMETMVAQYIAQIQKIQNTGPYKIIAWSMGGAVAFEMTRQLEAMGQSVERLILIDAHFPDQNNDVGESKEDVFSLKGEKDFISDFLEIKPAQLAQEKTIAGLWQKALDLLNEKRQSPESIRNKIPGDFRHLIPHLDDLDIPTMVAYANAIRTLDRTVGLYRTKAQLNTQLVFVLASESTINTNIWEERFEQEAVFIEVEGDHFSILQQPTVSLLAEKVGVYLKNLSMEFFAE